MFFFFFFFWHFVHPRAEISNLVYKWIFGCTVAKICYSKQLSEYIKMAKWIFLYKSPFNCLPKFNKFTKNDKQTVFEVYLKLTMPLNHVFRFLFKYGGWYLNCTYNYVCLPTEYENIWTNMSKCSSSVTILTHAHFVSTTHIHNITSICYLLVMPIMFNYYKMLNQSYIYTLVWKNAGQLSMLHSWRPAGLHTYYFTTNNNNVILNVRWSFIKSQKNANIGCWKINVIYIYIFFQMN